MATKGEALGTVTVKAPEKETPAEGVEEAPAVEGTEETPVTTLEAVVEIDQIAKVQRQQETYM